MTQPLNKGLAAANRVLARRRELRHAVAEGHLSIAHVLLNSDDFMASARVVKVLRWAPSIGPSYASRICRYAGVPEGRELGRLTLRQRGALVAAIAERRPGVLAA